MSTVIKRYSSHGRAPEKSTKLKTYVIYNKSQDIYGYVMVMTKYFVKKTQRRHLTMRPGYILAVTPAIEDIVIIYPKINPIVCG